MCIKMDCVTLIIGIMKNEKTTKSTRINRECKLCYMQLSKINILNRITNNIQSSLH